jgi:hypothetical protein
MSYEFSHSYQRNQSPSSTDVVQSVFASSNVQELCGGGH